jgi:uncharacterized membrane protein YcaP (DUF421 family)
VLFLRRVPTVMHFAEIAGRTVVAYAFALLVLRLAGRRTMSQLRPIDLIGVLLLSETLSPALTAGDDSLTAGVVAAAALGVASASTTWLAFRFHWFDHALDGQPLLLIKNGKLDAGVLREQRITDEALLTALHSEGLEAVAQVKKAFVEPDGTITIVKAEGAAA